jgi:hypothetical protein
LSPRALAFSALLTRASRSRCLLAGSSSTSRTARSAARADPAPLPRHSVFPHCCLGPRPFGTLGTWAVDSHHRFLWLLLKPLSLLAGGGDVKVYILLPPPAAGDGAWASFPSSPSPPASPSSDSGDDNPARHSLSFRFFSRLLFSYPSWVVDSHLRFGCS